MDTKQDIVKQLSLLISDKQKDKDIKAVKDLAYALGYLQGVSWGDEWGEVRAIEHAERIIQIHSK